MRAVLSAALIFLSGCSTYFARIEAGAGQDLGLASELFMERGPFGGSGERATVYQVSPQVGTAFLEGAWWGLDGIVGPHLVAGSLRSDGAGGIGLNLGLRARFKVSERVETYLFLGSGIMAWDERPDTQATHWGFIIQGGPGARYWLSDRLAVTADYRVWHQSNGSSVFFNGTKSPNAGYNSDTLFLGVEYMFD